MLGVGVGALAVAAGKFAVGFGLAMGFGVIVGLGDSEGKTPTCAERLFSLLVFLSAKKNAPAEAAATINTETMAINPNLLLEDFGRTEMIVSSSVGARLTEKDCLGVLLESV